MVDNTARRDSVICGPNAVYLFLVLSGVVPSEDSINAVDCGDTGASLLELKGLADAHGVPAEVRKFGQVELLQMPLPAICQTAPGRSGRHHFFIAYGLDAAGLLMLDPTDGEAFVLRNDHLDYLSGYVMVPRSSRAASLFGFGTGVCALLVVANGAFLLVPVRRAPGSPAARRQQGLWGVTGRVQ